MANFKSKEEAVVLSNSEIAPGVFSLTITAESAVNAKPGQFYMLFCKDASHILGRPISICNFDADNKTLRFVFQKKGNGTTEFSTLKEGDSITIMGPLGNGFNTETSGSHCVLVGGGMGIAPLLGLAKRLKKKAVVVLGYRDNPFMVEDFIDCGCKVIIATESGLEGVHGNVVDALKKEHIEGITAYACGPIPMLRAFCIYAEEHEIEAFVSLEERMGCGIGACLGCVTKAKEANDHYRVEKLCVCKDGPVFKATEVVL